MLLKKKLPDLFVRCAIEALQSPWPLRIELPHFERPSLARKSSTYEHHQNQINEGDVLFYHALDTLLQRRHFVRGSPIQALVGPGREPQRKYRSESRSSSPLGAAGFGDVEPLLLPHLDNIHKSPFGPGNMVELAHHEAAALGALALNYLRLHIKNLEP